MVIDTKKEISKEEFLIILSEKRGNVYNATTAFGISRTAYYNWLKNDEDFKVRVELIKEEADDYVKSKLFELIEGVKTEQYDPSSGENIVYKNPPCKSSVQFYLKGKEGFIEKSQVDVTTKGEKINQSNALPPIINVTVNGTVKDGE